VGLRRARPARRGQRQQPPAVVGAARQGRQGPQRAALARLASRLACPLATAGHDA
jgi:hypothetical protein